MSFLTGIWGAVTGKVPDVLGRAVDRVLPERLTEKEREEIRLAVMQATHEYEVNMLKLANEAELAFNDRLRDLEGTASDLKAVPVIGPLMLVVRGSVRPVVSLFVAWWDWRLLSGAWEWRPEFLEWLLAMNTIVFVFYFGERASRNVIPHVVRKLQNDR